MTKQQTKGEGEEVKKINLDLVGLDGNAFLLLGKFQKQARREGWTDGEMSEVLEEAKSGDYNHLLATLQKHCGGAENDK